MATITLRTSRLEELLSDRGIETNVAAGVLLGLNNGTLSRIRAGQSRPGPQFIAKSLIVFAVPFDDLFIVADKISA